MRVSVIVPARDAADTLPACLAAIERQEIDAPYEVIVVLGPEESATAEAARRAAGDVTVLREAEATAAGKRNRGAADARGEILAFTDADCFPTPGWLSAGLEEMKDADLIQGAVRPSPGASRGPFDRTLWVDREGLYETANLTVSRTWFERVGGFETVEDAGGRPFGEDVVFGWKVRRGGARTRFSADALVYHAVFPRGPKQHVVERLRLRYFAKLTVHVPELRKELWFARFFLNSRSAAFDVALASVWLGWAGSSRWPLLAAAPYVGVVTRRSRLWRGRALEGAAVAVVADAVGFLALAYGSLRYRRLLL